ncbi:DUF4395 domain-containing protein [Nocardioides sp. CFH 31398]|uniref:DUF4395 domain-containing protein n=1 Tax=Nocardioides sp. CFH 31398 TaxID=2919579 RepID=UPI001F05DCC2|nr:DUF4395 domain-containing protein [Nocardioides sp. CFH 31398]MCH1866023.1 DUF4395 domain-containing protein [Nocardioides sp. CFH 31398]
MSSPTAAPSRAADPRAARFAAALTSLVLVVVLLLGESIVGTALLALQTAVFAVGALAGPPATPYAALFRTVVRPRLAPPAEPDHHAGAPQRFAQAVGLAFTGVALVFVLLGATFVGHLFVGLALVAALLNAAAGLCLGCEMYLVARRLKDHGARTA